MNRPGRPQAVDTKGQYHPLMSKRGVAVAVVVLALTSACSKGGGLKLTPIGSPQASESSVCIDYTMKDVGRLGIVDYRFDKRCFRVWPYEPIVLKNNGATVHNFSVEGTSINYDVRPGKTVKTKPTLIDPSEYAFFCKYHRASGMGGILRVRLVPTPKPTPTPTPTPSPTPSPSPTPPGEGTPPPSG